MSFEKPVTDKMKERVNTLYVYMKEHHAVTKEEVMRVCGVKNERSAREILETLAYRKPILSTADDRGYILATTLEDYDKAIHTWLEIDSRQNALEKRKAPIIAFCEKCKKEMQEYGLSPN